VSISTSTTKCRHSARQSIRCGAATLITIDTKGIEKLSLSLSAFSARTDDFTAEFQKINTLVEEANKRHFDSEGDGDWTPLHQSTRPSRRVNPDAPMLRDSDQLYNSVTGQGRGAVRRVSRRSLERGTSLLHAHLQQEGGINDAGRQVPAREFLYMDEAETENIEDIFLAGIDQRLNETF
jgi:phage gpG-like protein